MADWSGPHPCTALAVDVLGYGRGDDRRQADIHHDLPRLMDRAAVGAGLDRSQWQIQRKGDEELAVYPMDASEPRLIDDFVRHLRWELNQYNSARIPALRLRLRLAVDHGPVELAPNGFAGATVVSVSRLLGADPLYEALRLHKEADLAVLLSDRVYTATVGSGHTTLTPADFREVKVQVKEYAAAAWLRVPGCPGDAALPPADVPGTGEGTEDGIPVGGRAPDTDSAGACEPKDGLQDSSTTGHHYQARQMSVTHFQGPADLRGANFGFGDAHD